MSYLAGLGVFAGLVAVFVTLLVGAFADPDPDPPPHPRTKERPR